MIEPVIEPAMDLGAYFARIGYRGGAAANLQTLRELHRLHAEAIPFENISSFGGEVVRVDLSSVQQKLVHGRRGGYCFEQNTLFWGVLRQLGFAVSGLSARVLWGVAPGTRTPRGHMLLRIALPEGTWLADVGFGGLTFTAPLQLIAGREQQTPHETLRLQLVDGEYRIEANLPDGWQPLYAFDLQEQHERDYEAPNWYTCTHPASIFVTTLRLGRPVPGGRHALLNNRYTRYITGAEPEVRYLESLAELRRLIAREFAIELPQLPGLDQKLGALLAPVVTGPASV